LRPRKSDSFRYDNYLGLVVLSKQQINWEEIKKSNEELGNGKLQSEWICPKNSATAAFS